MFYTKMLRLEMHCHQHNYESLHDVVQQAVQFHQMTVAEYKYTGLTGNRKLALLRCRCNRCWSRRTFMEMYIRGRFCFLNQFLAVFNWVAWLWHGTHHGLPSNQTTQRLSWHICTIDCLVFCVTKLNMRSQSALLWNMTSMPFITALMFWKLRLPVTGSLVWIIKCHAVSSSSAIITAAGRAATW